MSSLTDMISMSSFTKSERSKSVSSCIAPTTEAPEMAIATSRTATCCRRCNCRSGCVRLLSFRGLRCAEVAFALNVTCKAPMRRVDVRNAQMTPNARAIPNVERGGRGETTFAKNAATVVTTARERGTLNFPQARIHASATSSVFPR